MPFTSSYEPVEAGGTTFHELFAATAARRPDGVALDGLTYGELAGRVERAAALLAARGFGPGDVLAIRAPNTAAWAIVALAAMSRGGAVTGISPAATQPEVERQLADSGASILMTEDDFTPGLDGPARPVRVTPDDLALLPYSSGTSGLPKGVVLTHANLVTAVRQAQSACG